MRLKVSIYPSGFKCQTKKSQFEISKKNNSEIKSSRKKKNEDKGNERQLERFWVSGGSTEPLENG